MIISQVLVRFWCKYPALLYGLSALLGFYAFFYESLQVLIPVLGLWSPFLICMFGHHPSFGKPLLLSLTLFCACLIYATVFYVIPILPKEGGVKGLAYISIQSIHTQGSFFGSKWIYHCKVNQFYPESDAERSIARNIKCTVAFPNGAEIRRPPADHDYIVNGTLTQTDRGSFILKISTLTPWKAVQGSRSDAETRYLLKSKFQNWINGHFTDRLSAVFLSGLATGDFDDKWLRGEFARFGLQHIMAISGFHFAIVMGILSLILRLFLSRTRSAWVLLFLMSAYAFFLGPNPSIMRAWVMCILVIIGFLIEKNAPSLNSLGIALIVVSLFDPEFCKTIGFQFSFLTTAAILLLFGTLNRYAERLFIKRPLNEVIEMDLLNKHGYCILAFFKQGFALMGAVNLFAFPLTLYYFHQFPWMGLFYNLFFPFLVSISLCLLILGFLMAPVPFASEVIHGINNAYTQTLLKLTYGLPGTLDYYAKIDDFPATILIMYLTCMLLMGIVWHEKNFELDSDEHLLLAGIDLN